MKFIFILILSLGTQLIWSRTIYFDLPDYTLDQKVYLTGNTKELCNWNPKCVELKKINGLYIHDFDTKNQTQTEFKLTLGSWSSQATDQYGNLFKNTPLRKLKNHFKVHHWKNQIGRFHNHMLLNEQFGQINDGILIIGSSSARLWSTVEEDFFPFQAKSLGVGGGVMNDFNTYIHRLILTHEPRMYLFYMGENDIANGSHLGHILNTYRVILEKIHREKPNTPKYCLSIKVSPARKYLMQKITQFNQELKKLNCRYIELDQILRDQSGNLRNDIWLNDMLHLNHLGYKIWAKAILEQL